MKIVLSIVSLFVLGLVSGCGTSLPQEVSIVELGSFIDFDSAPSKDKLIDCYNGYCDSSYQYCLRSTMSLENSDYKTAYCRPKFNKCNNCSCAKNQAQRHFSMAKNCKGKIYCDKDGDKITVTCVVPPQS